MIQTNKLNEIKCFHHTTTDFQTGSNPPYHRHDTTYEIYVYIRGNVKIYIEDLCILPSPGNVILVRPNELHRSIVLDDTPYERIGINIGTACLRAFSSERTNLLDMFYDPIVNEKRLIRLSPENLTKFVSHVDSYLHFQKGGQYGSDLLSASAILQLFVLINRFFRSARSAEYENLMPELVIHAMRYIETHFTEEISLAEMSRLLNYSPNYLTRQFKLHTGLTLREYLLDRRIEAAKAALLDRKNVSEACSLAGFNDYANFIRSFTRKTGISPGKYYAAIIKK